MHRYICDSMDACTCAYMHAGCTACSFENVLLPDGLCDHPFLFPQSGGAVDAAFTFLTCGNVKEAISLCLKNKDYRLATLMAQGGWGNPSLMNHCREQLSEWEGMKVRPF